MEYVVVEIGIESIDFIPIFIAELSDLNYEGFEELEQCLKAYIPQPQFRKEELDDLLAKYQHLCQPKLQSVSPLKDTNWNALWESNFEPVMVEEEVLIKAPFHQVEKNYPYTITIEPKMSFGTGHHETTWLMIREMLDMDFDNKRVLDYGCGTAILSIMAHQLKAQSVFAIDYDSWAYENSLENVARNLPPEEIAHIKVVQGEKKSFSGMHFDVILANINKNVLLDSMEDIQKSLAAKGQVLMSGLLISDKKAILEAAQQQGLRLSKENQRNNWLLLKFER